VLESFAAYSHSRKRTCSSRNERRGIRTDLYALFFGQIALEGEHALSIDPEDWLKALHVLADSAIRPEYSDLAF